MEKQALPPRSEVPVEETWNLENIFASVEDWETAKSKVIEELPALEAYEGKLAEGPATLSAFLNAYEKAFRLALKVMLYGMLAVSADSTDQAARARAGQGQGVMVRIDAATSFYQPELMAIGFDTLHKWVAENPELAQYEHFIDELEREKEHIRSSEVEQVLAQAGEPLNDFFQAYNALTNADLSFEDAVAEDGSTLEVAQSSINSLITHQDRVVRQTGFDNYADGYLAFKNTLAATQIGDIHRDVFNARTRRYPSSLAASLGNNNIPVDVFHALIETFKKNLPTWHRYWKIRKQALGLDEFHV
jgi:oligoendopeptidase F